MTRDDMEIVSAVRQALLDRVGQQRFDVWFADRARLSWCDGVLNVTVPSQLDRDFVRRNFWAALEAACVSATGRAIPLDLQVIEREANATTKDSACTLKLSGKTTVSGSAGVLRVPGGSEANGAKCATSIISSVVSARTSATAPPIIPAKPRICSPSHITISSR